MKSKIFKGKLGIACTLGVILILVIFSTSYRNVDVINNDEIRNILEEINELCNSVYDNVDESEKKYQELVEIEKDYLKKGMYASVMVQINSIRGNYDGIIKYKNIAVENYMKVPNGELLAIAEDKYVAWIMFKVGKYSESLRSANNLWEIINMKDSKILNEDEIIDTKALVYSIYINIYTEFGLEDKAKYYYDKLSEIEIDEKLGKTRGDKIYYSKMLYASAEEDYELMKYYAEQMYEGILRADKANAQNYADAIIINIAYADIKLGNLDNVLEKINKTEEVSSMSGDEFGLVVVYETYAMYYEANGKLELALDYYNKALDLSIKLDNDFTIIKVLDETIEFCNKYGINNDLNGQYKLYFELTRDESVDKIVKDVLDESLNYNDALNIKLKNNSSIKNRIMIISNICWIILLVVLTILIVRMRYLYEGKKESERNLESSINRDYLTKVSTRKYGYKLIENLVSQNTFFSLAILDIDNFKKINDTYGHLFGDQVLKIIGEKLNEIVGKSNIILRYGGEEFVIAFVNMKKEESKELLDKAREEVSSIKFKEGLTVSFSAGIVEWNNEEIDYTIMDADKLLYKAKKEGKNRVY